MAMNQISCLARGTTATLVVWMTLVGVGCKGEPGTTGAPGAPGARGTDGISGLELIQREGKAPPRAGYHMHLKCPAGKTVISAGWFGNDNNIHVTSLPLKDGTWSVWFANHWTTEREVKAYGVCVIAL
jgi:hypothetical protein